MEISSQESDIQSVNETGSVSILTESIKDLLTKKLQYESLIWDIFRFEDDCFVVKNTNERSGGEILSHHFEGVPAVPGIMMKLLLLSLTKGKKMNMNNALYSKTTFSRSAVPGSKIFLGEDRMSLVDEKGKKYIQMEYIDKIDTVEPKVYKEGFRTLKKIKPQKNEKFPENELDKYLLQTGLFRFADSATFFHEKEEGDVVNVGDIFYGSCRNPFLDTCFFDTRGDTEEMYHGFFEEITAQIGSLAMGKVLGEVSNADSKILTFGKSIFKFDQKKLKKRLGIHSTVHVTGMVINKDKKHISFIFIGKNEKGQNLFRGEISGGILSAKYFNKVSLKRKPTI